MEAAEIEPATSQVIPSTYGKVLTKSTRTSPIPGPQSPHATPIWPRWSTPGAICRKSSGQESWPWLRRQTARVGSDPSAKTAADACLCQAV